MPSFSSSASSRTSTSRPIVLHVFDAAGEFGGGQHIGRLVDQIAGHMHALGHRQQRRAGGFQFGGRPWTRSPLPPAGLSSLGDL